MELKDMWKKKAKGLSMWEKENLGYPKAEAQKTKWAMFLLTE